MDRRANRRWALLLGVALCALTLAGFWGVHRCGFINYDDTDYITQNPHVRTGLSWPNIVWAFTRAHAGNWHPLTWLSHMLDCQLFGLNPGAQHLVNAGLHTANVLLLFLLLRRLTGAPWRSAFVAALFAVHPMHVESVAWLAERKDVLSAFFFFLTLLAYTNYARARARQLPSLNTDSLITDYSPRASHTNFWYALTLLLFVLGLMSKPMLVTLPFVLLLLDFWPLARLQLTATNPNLKTLLIEKLPFFVLAAASCIVTFIGQREQGAVTAITTVPVELRLANAPVSCLVYLEKLFWPTNLIAYYPIPTHIQAWMTAGAIAVLLLISFLAWTTRRRHPYLAFGWLWFLGMLVPVIGLVQVGLQAHADRYSYLPYIGLFVAVTWGLTEFARTWPRYVLAAVAFASVGTCFALTVAQVAYWHDSETLFRHTVQIAPENPVARLNLGSALVEQGKFAAAEEQFAEVVRLHPRYAEAQSNLGFVLAMQGKTDAAIGCYRTALALNPRFERTHSLLAGALLSQGKRAEAIAEYRAALEQNPDWPAALNDLAWILATDPDFHDGPESVRLAERACRLTEFREPLFIGTLAAAYAEAGRFEDAAATAERAAQVATANGQAQIAQRNKQLLEVYRAGKPFREPAQP